MTYITVAAGDDTEIQFNSSGAFAGDSNLTWDGSSLSANNFDTQTISRPTDTSTANLWIDGTGNINIGTSADNVIIGGGASLTLNNTSSTLSSELTIQDNFSRRYTESIVNTAGNATYTATQVFDGIIERDCNGADRTDTTPTAAQLVAIVPHAVVGSSIEVFIRNSSTSLELITLNEGTGVTFSGSLTVAAGITSRYLCLLTNITASSEAVTIFGSVPKDRVLVQGNFIDPTAGGSSTAFAQWGAESTATIDYVSLGVSGTITQLVCSYSHSGSIGIGGGESLAFSLGTSNDTLSTFTVYTGGTDIIIWDSSDDGTFPSTSSGVLSIPFTSTDRIAIRSQETGTVTPTTSEIRCVLTIELD